MSHDVIVWRRPVHDHRCRHIAEMVAQQFGSMHVIALDDIGRWITVPDELPRRDADRQIGRIRMAWSKRNRDTCEWCVP